MRLERAIDLVLVPGSSCDARVFAPQVAALEGRVRTGTVDITRHSRIDRLAAAALDALPERFALAGLSMGGLVALEIHRQAPERVMGLALLDSLAEPGLAIDRVRHRMAIGMLATRAYWPIDRIMWPRYVAPHRLGDADLHRTVLAMMRATGPRGLINQQRVFLTRPDYRPHLPAIAVPTLVLVGEEDTLAPLASARATAAAIPGAELVTVPGSGHLSTLEAPDAVTEALGQWLDRLAPGTAALATPTPRTRS